MAIEFALQTPNTANGSHGHWRVLSRLRKKQKTAVGWQLRFGKAEGSRAETLGDLTGSWTVTLTRFYPGQGLDPHDGLRSALKSPVDAVAEYLGLKSDRDPRVEWKYDQKSAPRGVHGLRIEIRRRGE